MNAFYGENLGKTREYLVFVASMGTEPGLMSWISSASWGGIQDASMRLGKSRQSVRNAASELAEQ